VGISEGKGRMKGGREEETVYPTLLLSFLGTFLSNTRFSTRKLNVPRFVSRLSPTFYGVRKGRGIGKGGKGGGKKGENSVNNASFQDVKRVEFGAKLTLPVNPECFNSLISSNVRFCAPVEVIC